MPRILMMFIALLVFVLMTNIAGYSGIKWFTADIGSFEITLGDDDDEISIDADLLPLGIFPFSQSVPIVFILQAAFVFLSIALPLNLPIRAPPAQH
ncbi:hypothetical protein AAD001_02705 [Colwelliaceae bacterium 6471]